MPLPIPVPTKTHPCTWCAAHFIAAVFAYEMVERLVNPADTDFAVYPARIKDDRILVAQPSLSHPD